MQSRGSPHPALSRRARGRNFLLPSPGGGRAGDEGIPTRARAAELLFREMREINRTV